MLDLTPTRYTPQEIRQINREIRDGEARYFVTSPLNGREHEISKLRSNKGCAQAYLTYVCHWRTIIGNLRRA